MNAEKLKALQIDTDKRQRQRKSMWMIFLAVLAVSLAAAYLARPRSGDDVRTFRSGSAPSTNSTSLASVSRSAPAAATRPRPGVDNAVLTTSGYIINRERIEISPRFLGVVKWIGVRKGDAVTNGQVIVLLDDAEYRARLHEIEGRIASAQAIVARAELNYERIHALARTDIESKQSEDDARLQLEANRAALKEVEGAHELARTYLDWCTIRSPIDGVVLEKLVNPNELVVPQSFGGARGPSTALIAVADPKDLQVEIDMNESDLSKISLKQRCRVSPEAYPDRHYEGMVAEIAPEADRAKGTLQIKVQILDPDAFLTPQLSARVEFLKR
jgi:HlyD family secretion protein